MSYRAKLDAGLGTLYANWLELRDQGVAAMGWIHPALKQGATGAHVSVRFTGDLSELERAGFETRNHDSARGVAYGIVRFDTLEAVAAVPGVIKLSYGREGSPRLDQAVPYVRGNLVRSFSSGAATGWEGNAGRNVIIAVLDTGIDIRHSFMQKPRATPTSAIATRILRIWDPGLEPLAGTAESGPAAALLGAGRPTYGVEYTEQMINDYLNDSAGTALRVRHRDCSGHGTHVASIAAGNGGLAHTYVGVAPLADIIVVKMLYLFREPMDSGAVISYDQRFRDAMNYVYNVAATHFENRRVVVNYSIGDDLGPHDGLSQVEEDLDAMLAADANRIIVAAAGNEAGRGQKSRATIPSGATSIRIPCKFLDLRGPSQMFRNAWCENRISAKEIYFEIWYAADPPQPLGGTLTIDGVTGTTAIPALGSHTQVFAYGPHGAQRFQITHELDSAVSGSTTVRRNFIRLEIWPDETSNQYAHTDARYVFDLTGAAGQVLHCWGSLLSVSVVMRIDYDDSATDSFTQECEIVNPASAAEAIAVGNYQIPAPAPSDGLLWPSSSSFGPLVQYGSLAPPPKPNIAAPGTDITAAQSRNEGRPSFFWTMLLSDDMIIDKTGTSMASPMVAGIVALMLAKNATLTRAQVRAAFRVLSGSWDPNELGSGVIDAQATLAAVP